MKFEEYVSTPLSINKDLLLLVYREADRKRHERNEEFILRGLVECFCFGFVAREPTLEQVHGIIGKNVVPTERSFSRNDRFYIGITEYERGHSHFVTTHSTGLSVGQTIPPWFFEKKKSKTIFCFAHKQEVFLVLTKDFIEYLPDEEEQENAWQFLLDCYSASPGAMRCIKALLE